MKILKDQNQEIAALEGYIRRAADGGRRLSILEAGCGREWLFNMRGVDFELTGVDMDAAAMEARKAHSRDLHHAIVGDIVTASLPEAKFDIVYCSYVLEHVEEARRAMENFVRWVRPGGWILLRVPDRDGAQGFLARHTPFWFHVLHYKLVLGQPNAGKPGFAPYPTYYDPVVSRAGVRDFCAQHGLELAEEIGHRMYDDYSSNPVIRACVKAAVGLTGALSLGRIQSDFADLTFVLRKPA
jgi:SAM-dependent methyltransferase